MFLELTIWAFFVVGYLGLSHKVRRLRNELRYHTYNELVALLLQPVGNAELQLL